MSNKEDRTEITDLARLDIAGVDGYINSILKGITNGYCKNCYLNSEEPL